MTNVLSNLSCETLYNMYRQYIENLQDLINDARTMLRNITDLIAFPFKRIEAMVQEYINALSNLPSLLDFSNINAIFSALKRMLDCPILADAFGKQISDILDSTGRSVQTLRNMVTSLLQSVADKVKSALDPIQKMLQSPLSKLTSSFENFVTTGALGSIMQYVHVLEQCLGNMCAAYKAVQSFSPGAIIKPLEKFGVTFKDGSMSFDKDTMMNAMKKKVTDIKDSVVKNYDDLQKSTKKKVDEAIALADGLKAKANSTMKMPKLKGAEAGG